MMMSQSNCEYNLRCTNNDRCYRCRGQSLLNLPKDKYQKRTIISASSKKYEEEESWKDLEEKVANKLNQVGSIKEARRSRCSGSKWYETGDIVDDLLHPECKERKGRDLKTGEKSITLQKQWLTKAKNECRCSNKKMCLPFRFKGDEDIYCIIDFNDLADLITDMKAFIKDNEIKTKELEILKNKLENK